MAEPVIVERSNSSLPAFAIVAVVVILAIVVGFWQPWNTTSSKTTIINQQPAGQAGAAGGAAGQSGAAGGTTGSGGSSSGSSSSNGQ